MENVWLIPVSLFLFSFLYLVLEKFLVRWFCRRYLRGRVQLMPPLEQDQKNDEFLHDVVKINEGDIMELSLLILTWFVGVATSIVSIVAVLETMHDSLHARSMILIPWAHIASWYYIIDTYAMFAAFVKKRNMTHRRIKAKLILFILDKWPFLFHHFLLTVLGYPLVVNEHLRGYKGDFYIALLFAQDMSNPFLANAKILNILGMTRGAFYRINGVLLILVFLLVRVLYVPLSILVFSAQYHDWRVIDALYHMRWHCHVCNLIQFLLQLYWFVSLMQLAWDVVRGWMKTGTKRQLQEHIKQQ